MCTVYHIHKISPPPLFFGNNCVPACSFPVSTTPKCNTPGFDNFTESQCLRPRERLHYQPYFFEHCHKRAFFCISKSTFFFFFCIFCRKPNDPPPSLFPPPPHLLFFSLQKPPHILLISGACRYFPQFYFKVSVHCCAFWVLFLESHFTTMATNEPDALTTTPHRVQPGYAVGADTPPLLLPLLASNKVVIRHRQKGTHHSYSIADGSSDGAVYRMEETHGSGLWQAQPACDIELKTEGGTVVALFRRSAGKPGDAVLEVFQIVAKEKERIGSVSVLQNSCCSRVLEVRSEGGGVSILEVGWGGYVLDSGVLHDTELLLYPRSGKGVRTHWFEAEIRPNTAKSPQKAKLLLLAAALMLEFHYSHLSNSTD